MLFGIFFPTIGVNYFVGSLNDDSVIRRINCMPAMVAIGDHSVVTAPLLAFSLIWYVHMTATLLFIGFSLTVTILYHTFVRLSTKF